MITEVKTIAHDILNDTGLSDRLSKSKKELLEYFDYDPSKQEWNLDTTRTQELIAKSNNKLIKDINMIVGKKDMDTILYDLGVLGIHPLTYIMNEIVEPITTEY